MKKQLKDNIIRVKDTIKIINPNIFIRCGYPLELKEITKNISIEYYDKIKNFVQDIIKHDNKFKNFEILKEINLNNPENEFEDIAKCLAYRYIKRHNFGGNKKEIYTIHIPELENQFCTVEETKIIHTGEYYPSSGGYDSYSGEYDYEPAYLANTKYHKILTVWFKNHHRTKYKNNKPNYDLFRIEAVNVEKIKDPEQIIDSNKYIREHYNISVLERMLKE